MELTQSYLKSILHYNPETGAFTWLVSRGNQFTRPGMLAGSDDGKGYRKIEIGGKGYYGHRLAFLYMTGAFPEKDTDHIDGNPSNDAWANLRAVSTRENMLNKRRYNNNKSGRVGVIWSKGGGKWVAHISVDKRLKHLGVFESLDDAIACREAAEIKYNYHPNHGRTL